MKSHYIATIHQISRLPMSKIRAAKERINRLAPKQDNFLAGEAEMPSYKPPSLQLDGAAQEMIQTQVAEAPVLEHTIDAQVLARGKMSKADIPHLPQGGGMSLPDDMKKAYEETLGISLNDVKVFYGPDSQKAIQTLGAEALTHKSNIYLKSELVPGDPTSERTLAHELLHVKQYKEGRIPNAKGKPLSQPNDPLELEAYSQENEVAKEAFEARGLSPDAAVFSQKFSPPPSPKVDQESNSDNGESFIDELELDYVPGEGLEEKEAATETPPTEANSASPVEAAPENISAESGEGAARQGGQGETLVPSPLSQVNSQPAVQSGGNSTIDRPERQSVSSPATETFETSVEKKHAAKVDLAAESAKVKTAASAQAAAVRANGASNLAAFQAKSAATKANIRQKLASAKQQVTAAYNAQKQLLQAKATAQLASIAATAAAQKAVLQAFAASEIQRYTTAKATEIQLATAAVETKKAETRQAAETEANRAKTESEQDAQTILSEAASFSMGSESEANEEKRKALDDIAQDTAAKIRKNGEDVSGKLNSEVSAFDQKYDETLANYLEGIEAESSKYVQEATALGTSVNASIDKAASESSSAVNAALNQGIQALDAQANAANSELDASSQAQIQQIDSSESQLVSAFKNQYSQDASELERYGSDCSSQLLGASANDAAGVAAAVAEMEKNIADYGAQMQSAYGKWSNDANVELAAAENAATTSFNQVAQSEQSRAASIGSGIGTEIDAAGTAANQSINQLVTETQSNITAATDEIIGGLTQARTELEAKLAQILQDATAQFVQFINDGLQAGKDLMTTARSQMQKAVTEIDSKYRSLKEEAEAKSSQVSQRVMRGFWSWLGGIVESVGQWFKATFGDWLGGFLFGLIQAIVMIAVGMVALWALGALLVAAGVSAATAGIVVLVVGLVVAVGFGIYSRWQEYKADHNGEGPGFWAGLGLVTIGILDITGIPFMIEGIVGQRITGGKLDNFQRSERFAMGLVFLVAMGVSAAKALRGPTRVPIDAERLPIDGERLPVDGERLPADGERLPGGNEERLPEGNGNEERLPEGNGNEERLPEGNGNEERLPEGNGNEERLPEGNGNEERPVVRDEERFPNEDERLPNDEERVPNDEERIPEDERTNESEETTGGQDHPAVNGEVKFGDFNYSQKTVNGKTGDGTPLEVVVESMREHGYDRSKQPPQMVDLNNGKLVTLDHRRLVAAYQAEVKSIPIERIAGSTPIDQAFAISKNFVIGKMSRARMTLVEQFLGLPEGTIKKGYVAQTWEEAAVIRCANQGNSFPIDGSPNLPTISGN